MKFEQKMLEAVRAAAVPLTGSAVDYDKLLDALSDAQIVLLGEATHGTQEFYDIRATISKRLITEKSFNAIAIEGDWPDAYQVNQYITGQDYKTAAGALASFDRFPTWMWRNEPIVALAEWLKDYNAKQSQSSQINFYGLDLYSLYRSIDAVIAYLKKVNPEAALPVLSSIGMNRRPMATRWRLAQ
jgi:erythromycin esterase-like protein